LTPVARCGLQRLSGTSRRPPLLHLDSKGAGTPRRDPPAGGPCPPCLCRPEPGFISSAHRSGPRTGEDALRIPSAPAPAPAPAPVPPARPPLRGPGRARHPGGVR